MNIIKINDIFQRKRHCPFENHEEQSLTSRIFHLREVSHVRFNWALVSPEERKWSFSLSRPWKTYVPRQSFTSGWKWRILPVAGTFTSLNLPIYIYIYKVYFNQKRLPQVFSYVPCRVFGWEGSTLKHLEQKCIFQLRMHISPWRWRVVWHLKTPTFFSGQREGFGWWKSPEIIGI